MATVGTELSMSLDGFIADPADGVESAVKQAKAVAGEKMVGVGAADIV